MPTAELKIKETVEDELSTLIPFSGKTRTDNRSKEYINLIRLVKIQKQ